MGCPRAFITRAILEGCLELDPAQARDLKYALHWRNSGEKQVLKWMWAEDRTALCVSVGGYPGRMAEAQVGAGVGLLWGDGWT